MVETGDDSRGACDHSGGGITGGKKKVPGLRKGRGRTRMIVQAADGYRKPGNI